jgi:hypothetical protein
MRSLIAFLICIPIAAWCGAAEAPPTPVPAAPASRAVLTAEQVIRILDDTVEWYRTLGTQQLHATQPSDLLILFANRQTADKVVALAFDIARANAELLSSEAGAGRSTADPGGPQTLAQRQSQLDAERRSIEAQMKSHRSRATELRGELAMLDARRNLLDTMSEFVSDSDPKSTGANALKAQIDAIAATIPAAGANPAGVAAAAASPAGSSPSAAGQNGAARSASIDSGIWALGANALRLKAKIAAIDSIDRSTAALSRTFEDISTVPVRQLKDYGARGDALAAQADHAGGAALQALRDQFDTLAWLFKQTSAMVIPLAKEQILLRQYRHTLGNWRDTAVKQYKEALEVLGVRLGILLGLLAGVFLIGEVWKRIVLRYSHDQRRRYQLLLLRKIAVWTVAAVIVGLSFVTEISTFATFAGLLTAGIAVAMQSVLVSVVGYFFLIGKYGIRVGDRIQIGTVVGDVIDIGLVRMHLMELNTSGPLGPTGRVVAFANLIVFQPSGGLFKQIRGVNLTWHETVVTLPAVSDYAALKRKLLADVGAIVGEYHDEILRQTREIEKSTASAGLNAAMPQVHMRIAGGRMEAQIGYPVSHEHAVDIDERVSEAVLKVIAEAAPTRGAEAAPPASFE